MGKSGARPAQSRYCIRAPVVPIHAQVRGTRESENQPRAVAPHLRAKGVGHALSRVHARVHRPMTVPPLPRRKGGFLLPIAWDPLPDINRRLVAWHRPSPGRRTDDPTRPIITCIPLEHDRPMTTERPVSTRRSMVKCRATCAPESRLRSAAEMERSSLGAG